VGLITNAAEQLQIRSVLVQNTQRSGIWIDGGSYVNLEQVRVVDVAPDPTDATPVGVGVVVVGTAGLIVSNVLVERCHGSGLIHYGGDAQITSSVFRDNQGYGIAVGCSRDDICPASPNVEITNCLSERNWGVGIWLSQVMASVVGTSVTETLEGELYFSRGVEVVGVPDVTLEGNQVTDGDDLGIFLHESGGSIEGNTVSNHGGRGIMVQNPASWFRADVLVSNSEVQNSGQVGVCAVGFVDLDVVSSVVENTRLAAVIVDGHTVQQGDGIQSQPSTTLLVDSVAFDGNERTAIMADVVDQIQVINSTFGDQQTEGAIIISRTDPGNIDTQNNQDLNGSAVSPQMPPDPLEYDNNFKSTQHPPSSVQ
jgi:parallel beta-helix repeat protein